MIVTIAGCVLGLFIARYALYLGLEIGSVLFGLVVGACTGWAAAKESK